MALTQTLWASCCHGHTSPQHPPPDQTPQKTAATPAHPQTAPTHPQRSCAFSALRCCWIGLPDRDAPPLALHVCTQPKDSNDNAGQHVVGGCCVPSVSMQLVAKGSSSLQLGGRKFVPGVLQQSATAGNMPSAKCKPYLSSVHRVLCVADPFCHLW